MTLPRSRLIRRRALAKMLSVSEPTIWRWERAGHLPPKIQVGPNVVGWDREQIEEWLARRGFGVKES